SAPLRFFFARPALLVSLFDVLGLPFLFAAVFLFRSSSHEITSQSEHVTNASSATNDLQTSCPDATSRRGPDSVLDRLGVVKTTYFSTTNCHRRRTPRKLIFRRSANNFDGSSLAIGRVRR